MQYWESIKSKIEENFDSEVRALETLLSIDSTGGEAKEIKGYDKDIVTVLDGDTACLPFGEGVHEAFTFMLSRARGMGFTYENTDNYGGHVEFGESPDDEVMAVVCHLDVVPAGDGWDSDPFKAMIKDGKIYGRGTTDNKGPAIAALYAMKAIDEAGFVPGKKVRLVLGLDEETAWKGIKYYNERIPAPDMGFTPDADFPVINGEKGILEFVIARKFAKTTNEGIELRSISGGNAANMVAGSARAVIKSDKTKVYGEIRDRVAHLAEAGVRIKSRPVGKSLEISTLGVSAHGARPEKGDNAISTLMEFLAEINFANDDINEYIEFYNDHIGRQTDGDALGCRMEDEVSGVTTVNVGMIEADAKSAALTVNVRYPVSKTEDEVFDALMPLRDKFNLGIVKGKSLKPIFRSEDDPFIRKLVEVYADNTGDRDSKPLVIGGGTYARAFENIVAFGCRFPGEPEYAHQKNEHLSLENLKKITYILADAIYRLTS